MIKKYRKKPPTIEAVQFLSNYNECEKFIGKDNYDNTFKYPNVLVGRFFTEVKEGDYIIKLKSGSFSKMTQTEFEKTYEEVNE